MHASPLRRFGLLLVLFGLVGCAAQRPKDAGPVPPDSRRLEVFDGKTGTRVSWDRLVIGAVAADAVLLGENHGHPVGLDAAATLWDDVLGRTKNAALAMEFFERDQQIALDDYLTGVTDEKTFRERARRTEPNYPPGHRRMVEAAKRAGRPVIAPNAPRVYVHLAGKGYERLAQLTPAQRAMYRVPDELPGGRYRADFESLMKPGGGAADKAHPAMSPEAIDAMFRSQSMWDWTMADSVARSLEAGNRPVVLVVGRFHVDFDGGTVQALRTLRPGASLVSVSFVDQWSPRLRSEDRGRATYVVYVGPAPEPGT